MALGGIDQPSTTYLAFGKYFEKKWEYNKEECQLFRDFEKAYDSINRISVRYPNYLNTRKRRPRNSWMQEVTTGMREAGIDDLEWVDREGWRKKINLP